MDLPFPLGKRHRSDTKGRWKSRGLAFENDLAFSIVYKRYIYARQCELKRCQKVFTESKDRQMEHDHDTGKFRNIVCNKCNQRKADVKIQSNNTSGYKGISWDKVNNSWKFYAAIDGKQMSIKMMKDLDKLIAFAEQWKIDNNYYT